MDLLDEPEKAGNQPEFTVSEISGALKKSIEGQFGHVRVRAEVGRVVRARSGHLYFDLKDDRNVLACTTWKGQISGLSVIPEEGMEVVATGRMTTFGSQSKYQLNASEVTVAGVGALMAMLEKRKKALAAEGLFDPARKKPIPFLPDVIGVITSPQGAVIRDILHRLRDRFPRRVIVWPVAVQGKECAPQVARAIAGFNALQSGGVIPRPDLLIVARGGGSIEDLWGFNEESVARAAAASDIPLISAVGHETDTTLIDFVSDKRAPTPTAAAELAVPVRLDLIAHVNQLGSRMSRGLSDAVSRRSQRVSDVSRLLPRPADLLADARQRADYWGERLDTALHSGVNAGQLRLSRVSSGLRPSVLRTKLNAGSERLQTQSLRLAPALDRNSRVARRDLSKLAPRLRSEAFSTLITQSKKRLADTVRRLNLAAKSQETRRVAQLERLEGLRKSLGYEATLKRGYAVVRGDGALVTTTEAAKAAAAIEIQFADGHVKVGASQTEPRAPKRKKSDTPDGQGSLF